MKNKMLKELLKQFNELSDVEKKLVLEYMEFLKYRRYFEVLENIPTRIIKKEIRRRKHYAN